MMNSKFLSIVNRMGLKKLPSDRNFFGTFFKHTISSRSIYTAGRYTKTNLYSILSPLGSPSISLVPELDKWVEKGKKVIVPELQRIIRDLRRRRRFTHALEVSEWMRKKDGFAFSSSEHAVQLDLIGRVRGVESAECYFNSLNNEDKTDKTYGALLNCYTKAGLTDKSLSHLLKMKELGFASSPLCYNNLMVLYTNNDEHEKVPSILNKMKENRISPDNFSYRICINSYGSRSKIDEMEKILEEMENQPHITMEWNTYASAANFYIKAGLTEKAAANLKKSEDHLYCGYMFGPNVLYKDGDTEEATADRKGLKLDTKDMVGFNHLISLYASLGDKTEVARLWQFMKIVKKKYTNTDYITMLSSLARLDDLEGAEKLLNEWESSGNSYDFRVPNVLILVYAKTGLVEKAEALLDDITKKGVTPTPNSWGSMAAGYVRKEEMEKAVRCMKMAFSVTTGAWKPNPKTVSSILSFLGDKGEVEEVESFVQSLKTITPVDKSMYHALLKAYVRAGKNVSELLESMEADKIVEDEETAKILSSKSS